MSGDFNSWTPSEVAVWVSSIGPKYKAVAESFEEAGVDGAFLAEITDDDLKELGLASGFHRKRFRHAVDILKASNNSSPSPTPQPKKTSVVPKQPAPVPKPPTTNFSAPPKPPSQPGSKKPAKRQSAFARALAKAKSAEAGNQPDVPPAPGGSTGPPPAPVSAFTPLPSEPIRSNSFGPPPAPAFSKPPPQPNTSSNFGAPPKRTPSKFNISSIPKKPISPAAKTTGSEDPFADFEANSLYDAMNKKRAPPAPGAPPPPPGGAMGNQAKPVAEVRPPSNSSVTNHPPPPKPPGSGIPGGPPKPPAVPGGGPPIFDARKSMPPPVPSDLIKNKNQGNDNMGDMLGLDLPPPPPRASAIKSLNDDLPDLPFDDNPGSGGDVIPPPKPPAPPGGGPDTFIPPGTPGMQPGGSTEVSLGQPIMISKKKAVATPSGPKLDLNQFSGEPDRVYLQLSRPGNHESATAELSTALALCCASLQLTAEQLQLFLSLSDRLKGRDQVMLNLSNAHVTQELVTHVEFLQVCYLIGYEVEKDELVCLSSPEDEILNVFQNTVKEFQYSQMESYMICHADELNENEIDILKIIIALTHEYTQATDDVLETLSVFLPYLTDHSTMLKMLRCWFEWCAERSAEKLNRAGNVRFKIATIVKYILRDYHLELETGAHSEDLRALLDLIKEKDLIAFSHIEAVRQSHGSSAFFEEAAMDLEGANANEKIDLLSLRPEMVSEQLTLLNQKLFSVIPLREILDSNFDDTVLSEFITRFTNISRWIQLAIFCESSISNRADRIRWSFKFGEKSLENNDWLSFLAICDALMSNEVKVFENSWGKVFKKKMRSKRDYQIILQQWEQMVTQKSIKEKFWCLQAPAVPPHSVIMRNARVMDEYREISNNKVELFCHFRKLHKLIKQVKSLQGQTYELENNEQLQHALEAELRLQSQLKKSNISVLLLQACNNEGVPPPSGVSGPRPSMLHM